jgi:hypothetical protein
MFLGNIVSEKPIKVNGLFYITNDITTINREIPTLIIGWDFSKRILPNKNLSIIEKRIEEFLFWTFSKKEKRIEYEKDLKIFVKSCINAVEKKVKYQYINLLTVKCDDIKKIIKNMTSREVWSIYIYKNSFIYGYSNNRIIGVDLNIIDYLGINRKKVYKILYSNGNKVIFSDDFLTSEIKENVYNNQKIISYLYSIENDDK